MSEREGEGEGEGEGDVSRDFHSGPTLFGVVRAATAFLTRVPVGKKAISQSDTAWAPSAFPLVGAGVGAGAAAVFHYGTAPLGTLAAAGLAVAASVCMTGAFHEDGLSDTADALFGSVQRDRALEIMKDSRIGSYGAIAVALMLIMRVALVSRCDQAAFVALVWAGCVARVGPVWLMTFMDHASPTTSKHQSLLSTPRACAAFASLIAAGLGLGLVGLAPAAAVRVATAAVAVALVALWFARLANRRLGGITGDLLGATEQIGEIAVLLVFAWHS